MKKLLGGRKHVVSGNKPSWEPAALFTARIGSLVGQTETAREDFTKPGSKPPPLSRCSPANIHKLKTALGDTVMLD